MTAIPTAIGADERVKLVLDSCRLDYVYEPAWDRLLARVCGLLESSKTVAWCQPGEADGGGADRLVLADPRARFVRDNVNGFLLGRDLNCSLPLVRSGDGGGELDELLAAWQRSTGGDALVAAAFLRDRREPVDGPRMAVQAFFSSAVDAIVIGRFLLMKDYWLMRMPQTAAGAV